MDHTVTVALAYVLSISKVRTNEHVTAHSPLASVYSISFSTAIESSPFSFLSFFNNKLLRHKSTPVSNTQVRLIDGVRVCVYICVFFVPQCRLLGGYLPDKESSLVKKT